MKGRKNQTLHVDNTIRNKYPALDLPNINQMFDVSVAEGAILSYIIFIVLTPRTNISVLTPTTKIAWLEPHISMDAGMLTRTIVYLMERVA